MLTVCHSLWTGHLPATHAILPASAAARLAGLPAGLNSWLLPITGALILLLILLLSQWRRDQAELSALRRRADTSSSRFRAIFHQTGAGIAVLSPAGRFLQTNPRLCTLLGYSEAELCDLTFRDITHPDDLPFNLKLCDATLAGRRSEYQLEKRYRHKDGRYLWIEATVTLVRDKRGEPDYFISLITDISSRKQAETVLLESKNQLQMVLEGGQLGFWDWDIRTGEVQRNARWAEMLGYTLDEIRFSTGQWTDLIHPDDRERAWQSINDHLAGRTPAHILEYRMLHKDGSIRWILDHAKVVSRDADGAPLRMSGTHTDITQFKQSDTALRESEERLRIIVEASQAGIILVDPRGTICFANRRMAELLGTTLEQLTGTTYLEHVATVDRSAGEDRMSRLIRGDLETVASERKYRRRDGSEFWGHLSGRRLLGPDGQLQYLVGVIQDVNDRRQALDALEESERRFRELLETIQLAAVVIDCEARVTFCNDFLLKLSGQGREEVIGHDWVERFVPEPEREQQRRYFQQAFTGTLEVNRSCPLATRHGQPRIMVWDSTLLRDENGAVIGLASIGRDVTDQRNLESQLLQAQKMEAIGLLAGGVAHDFNNLLSVMIGLGELLRRQLADREQSRALVERILGAAEKGAFLTRGLLALSRKQVLDIQPIDLNSCLVDLCRLLPRIIGEDIRFNAQFDPQPLPVRADRIQLEQVLINLVTNARDAMPQGGRLEIATSHLELTADAARSFGLEGSGRFACIQVKDTGHGMEQAVQERIFEPFYTTKGISKGTGLGLSTAFGTIRQHQGSIRVDSSPGTGTAFSIYLPLLEGTEVPALTSHAEPRMVPGHETLLLVDDDPDVRHSTGYILETSGYRVLTAEDGEEALELYRQHADEIDLVMLDVIMPGMNGREVLEEIRRTNPGIRALFISGYADDLITSKGIDESFHVLSKPFHPATLLEKLRELLDAD